MLCGSVEEERTKFRGKKGKKISAAKSGLVAGAYLGGALGHGPPLGPQDSIISIEQCAKGPLLCNLGSRFGHRNGGGRFFGGQKPD